MKILLIIIICLLLLTNSLLYAQIKVLDDLVEFQGNSIIMKCGVRLFIPLFGMITIPKGTMIAEIIE